MKPRLIRIAKLSSYPLFYLASLVLFGYLCFPFNQLRGRIIAEFDRMQQAERRRGPAAAAPMKLELGELSSYWLSGIEVRDAKLVIPPDPEPKKRSRTQLQLGSANAANDEEGSAEPAVVTIDRAHARVRLLPLLAGSVRIDFGVEAFGGEIDGTAPYGTDSDVEVTIEGLELGRIEPLQSLTGLPIRGKVDGELKLSPQDGKFAKADGKLELRIGGVVIGDGKATLQGVALPAARVGDLAIIAEAKDGVLKIDEISAAGPDFELSGDGRIRLRERWNRSRADINLKFRFTDSYRDKDDTTRSLLGEPGSKIPPALEFDPRVKRSKTADGFYGWHVHGSLASLKFDPQPVKGAPRQRGSARQPSGASRNRPSMANQLKGRLGRGKRTVPSRERRVPTGRVRTTPTPREADDDRAGDAPPAAPAEPPQEEESPAEEQQEEAAEGEEETEEGDEEQAGEEETGDDG